MLYRTVNHCRSCTAPLGNKALDFGNVPVADALSDKANDQSFKAPLSIKFCDHCGLLQLGSHLLPEVIFNQRYPYFSSSITSLVVRMEKLAEQLVAEYSLNSKSRVVEIASNDGYLLRHFDKLGIPVLGVEPSERQAAQANALGIDTIGDFFCTKLAQKIIAEQGKADLIIANNVVAHVPDINNFIAGVSQLLSESGTAVLEFHYLSKMLIDCQFDTLYHQHVYYYSLRSFSNVIAQHNLSVNHVEQIDSYGGSLRAHISHRQKQDDSVRQLLTEECECKLDQYQTYQAFAQRALANSKAVNNLICKLNKDNNTVVGYGAAAKSSTLLKVCSLDHPQLLYLVDQNPHKHGLYMPGTNLLIKDVSVLASDPPDYILILAWNYAEEIMQSLSWFQQQGGQFILPSPNLEVI